MTPLGALARGLVAGLLGTAAMTAYQEALSRVRGSSGGDDGGDPSWDEAPAPAHVAKRVLEGVFEQPQPPARIPLLTDAMHWGYGSAWGLAYGAVQATMRRSPLAAGVLFGTGVWAMSYVQLVPMGLYDPPWEEEPKALATDLSYHLVYGLGVAAAFDALDGGQ